MPPPCAMGPPARRICQSFSTGHDVLKLHWASKTVYALVTVMLSPTLACETFIAGTLGPVSTPRMGLRIQMVVFETFHCVLPLRAFTAAQIVCVPPHPVGRIVAAMGT